MINVKYEIYANDFYRKNKEKTFYNLNDFVDWFFNLCQGDYKEKIAIPDPDSFIWKDGPSNMDVNNMWTQNCHYWVHQIERDDKIIFSDGKHTNYFKHWNEEVKQLCRDMIKRRNNPVFNFG